jgi:hypothetical protein
MMENFDDYVKEKFASHKPIDESDYVEPIFREDVRKFYDPMGVLSLETWDQIHQYVEDNILVGPYQSPLSCRFADTKDIFKLCMFTHLAN